MDTRIFTKISLLSVDRALPASELVDGEPQSSVSPDIEVRQSTTLWPWASFYHPRYGTRSRASQPPPTPPPPKKKSKFDYSRY